MIPSPFLSLYTSLESRMLACDMQRAEQRPTNLLRSTHNKVHWSCSNVEWAIVDWPEVLESETDNVDRLPTIAWCGRSRGCGVVRACTSSSKG